MSILIKGMEMPTDHPLWLVVHADGTVEASEVSPSRPVGWQTLRNAAVPVPPHGDLIDTRAVDLSDGPYEYQDWVEWAWEQYLNAPVFLPADSPKEEA